MSAPPYMQLYVADYLGDTRHLTTEQHGAYLLLLMSMWRAGGSLPNDPGKLARIVSLTSARWAKISPEVMEFFDAEEGRLTQRRVKKELEKFSERSAKRSAAGARGGNAKALNSKRSTPANANDLLEQTGKQNDAISDIRHQISDQERELTFSPREPALAPQALRSEPKAKRGSRLSRDWRPSAEDTAYALSKGFLAPQVERMGEDFRDYWVARPDGLKVEWAATWQRWVRSEADRRGLQPTDRPRPRHNDAFV